MGALLRYIHPPPLSFSGDIFRRAISFPSKVPVGAHASEMVLHSEKQTEYMFHTRVQFSSLIREIALSNDSSYSKKDILLLLRPELRIYYGLTEAITNHQVMIATKAFFVAQALMFILPPNVLAEICEVTDNSYFNMPLLFIISLIGATVGGLLARQRRGELKRLNDQLRQINAALRRQAKIESYAPKLSYAPVGKTAEPEVVVDPKKEELIIKLRTGKNYLRNHELEKAYAEFKAALELSEALKNHVEEKKAARGLGASLQRQGKYKEAIKYHSKSEWASLQRQGKYKEAIKYHSKVLEIARRAGEDSGSTEAYGAIADCYTELGDLEKAGQFYDKYIARLQKDSDCL